MFKKIMILPMIALCMGFVGISDDASANWTMEPGKKITKLPPLFPDKQGRGNQKCLYDKNGNLVCTVKPAKGGEIGGKNACCAVYRQPLGQPGANPSSQPRSCSYFDKDRQLQQITPQNAKEECGKMRNPVECEITPDDKYKKCFQDTLEDEASLL